MKTSVDCINCIINQGAKIANSFNLNEDSTEKLLQEILKNLSTKKYFNTNPPQLAKDVYQIIYKHINNYNPYKELKEFYNNEILSIQEKIEYIIEVSENRFQMAVKMAIVGNVIDFGASHKISPDIVLNQIEKAKDKDLVIDNSDLLFKQLAESKTLLYLGDNCGEIVFDKIFIKLIKELFPKLEITFATRGSAVINDVTKEDAYYVGIDKYAKIIDNGDNAPGTILDNASKEFNDYFNKSDVIISKGQGNFETLNLVNKKNIFFLFMTKCSIVNKELGVEMFSLVCKKID